MSFQLCLFDESKNRVVKFPSTRYQGSKLRFANWIWECIKDIPFHTVLDAFGGTGAVSFRLKQEQKKVTYNDILQFNYIIGKALIENRDTLIQDSDIDYILSKHSAVKYKNFISTTFKDIYYTEEENAWLDTIIANIRTIDNPYKQAIAFFALFQSCLIKRPYNLFHRKNLYVRLKDVKRSFGNKKTWDTPFEIHFRKFIKEANSAIFDNGEICKSQNNDVFDISGSFDLVYIDTPYLNEVGIGVDYAEFYHFLNGIVDYDNWRNNIDYESKHLRLLKKPNVWNNPEKISKAFEKLFIKFSNSILVVSYRSNGTPSIEDLMSILKRLNKRVNIFYSPEIKYALSSKKSTEVLLVAY